MTGKQQRDRFIAQSLLCKYIIVCFIAYRKPRLRYGSDFHLTLQKGVSSIITLHHVNSQFKEFFIDH